ncbi:MULTISPECIES: RtcB family protein [unclassified Thermosipho (in: thermotogales)]|uniref:RtcB family protein n=1 Tax=unclassified Thermosipho (in: thermotogales) TaxID=2676525 RepID=UPI0009CF64DC|nr:MULTISPECIES: RtcB family protein [unclassified Thermosipho (in: thermotogales)]MBT1247645.1 tRNA-splicing ligase [Thermosipho sp. 1244]OOC46770.1 tRNA-splicing ligase [Thermosipho sp. 1223]
MYRIKKSGKMKVDAFVLTDSLNEISEAIEQLKNVASLPSIVKAAYAMPDIHWGYGFPIGGVAAFSEIISPGGVGFDINCGVRLLKSEVTYKEISKHIQKVLEKIYKLVPVGLGSTSKKFEKKLFKKIIENGTKAVIELGFGYEEDLNFIEDNGTLLPANMLDVSDTAYKRGKEELGTLGSGNHFIEIQKVEEIYDKKIANVLGLFEGQITVMIHTGSRGFGHQVATDYIKLMRNLNIDLPDKQLVYAQFKSEIGQKYYSAMNCAANFAFSNRQIITHLVRKAFSDISKLYLVYDVVHNIAKVEIHDGQKVIVHRKGATRALGPGQKELPEKYENIGQPVIIPGDMGTFSYILVGTNENFAFSSTAHGAGRILGRRQALKKLKLNDILSNLERKGIILKSKSKRTIIEEAPNAYKDIDKVVEIVDKLRLSKKVAKLVPLGVIKG